MAKHEDEAELDDRLLHRMLFFSDAVFAIVMTLLVLELRPPEGASALSAETLEEMSGHIQAFGMSFLLTGVFWIAHMSTTRALIRFDWRSAWANLVFLFPVCLIPFASSWLGEAIGGAFAWTVYCSVLVATSLGNVILVLVTKRDGGRLIAGGVTPRERWYRVVRAVAPGVAFGIGLALVPLNMLGYAHLCWVLIPVTYALASRYLKPKGEAAG